MTANGWITRVGAAPARWKSNPQLVIRVNPFHPRHPRSTFFRGRNAWRWVWLLLIAAGLLTLAGCAGANPQPGPPVDVQTARLQVSALPCTAHFVSHDLDHVTTVAGDQVRMYEANGAGVALHDLDNDGDLDVVLGNYDGMNTVFWNVGGLSFQKEELPVGRTRAVTAVDVDGDGWSDLVFTHVGGAVSFWHNRGAGVPENGTGRFEQSLLPGFSQPAYALDWGDLDNDGDLDAVSASYDIGLLTELGNEYLLNGGGGVYVHWNAGGRFRAERLAPEAQALALALWDLDGNGRLDLLVGNDFAVPDQVWLNREDGWRAAAPFVETTHSTMSYDLGDVTNNGRLALFATDMKPYRTDPETMAAWAPLMAGMMEHPPAGDPQIMENVLLISNGWTGYRNAARAWGADATGWSWSSVFGDLDQDGWLDLYVVNGFMEAGTFAHLPDHELVEENQVLRNLGRSFERRPDWGLGSLRSGRGMALGDLDGDGDLDAVVNNLRTPAQLFENQLCGGDALLLDLRWPGSGNTHAVGAQVLLETSLGSMRRDVRVTRGYLSGDSGRLHFGLPAGVVVRRLVIRWPDGAETVLADPGRNVLLTVKRIAAN